MQEKPVSARCGGRAGFLFANISANLHRRHLDHAQYSMVGARSLEVYEKRAKERQREHGGTAPGKKNTGGQKSTSVSGKSRDEAGVAVGVDGKARRQLLSVRQTNLSSGYRRKRRRDRNESPNLLW